MPELHRTPTFEDVSWVGMKPSQLPSSIRERLAPFFEAAVAEVTRDRASRNPSEWAVHVAVEPHDSSSAPFGVVAPYEWIQYQMDHDFPTTEIGVESYAVFDGINLYSFNIVDDRGARDFGRATRLFTALKLPTEEFDGHEEDSHMLSYSLVSAVRFIRDGSLQMPKLS